MLTWTDLQTQAQDMAFDYTSTTLTFLQRNMNIGQHILESELGSYFTEDTRYGFTDYQVQPPASAPTITVVGTAGATSYGYKITALTNSSESTASTQGSTSTGNATLSSSNFNQVQWLPVPGATAYNIYRTVGGATQGKIGQVSGSYNYFNDTNLAASGTVPTTNATLTFQLPLPENCIRVKTFFVTIGNVRYAAEEVFDESVWQQIQAFSQNSRTNYVQKMFRRRNTLEVFPAPSSSQPYTMIYESEARDLSIADYTTGTILTLTNGSQAVVGTTTAWTQAMVGRYIQFSGNNDLQFYLVQSVTDATHLTLANPYQGIPVNAGSQAYRIGEVPRTPGPTHIIPVYYALMNYYKGPKKASGQAPMDFEKMYKDMTQWAKSTYGKRYSTAVIPSQRELMKHVHLMNPNWFPTIT